MGTSHRQQPVKSLVGEIRAGLRELFALPDGLRGRARQRRRHGLLGRRGLRADRGPLAAPGLRRVLLEVRARSPRRRRSSRSRSSSTPTRATRPTRPRIRREPPARRVDVLAWAHNETSTGVMVPVLRPPVAGDALVLIDATSGAGGLPVEISQADAYYFAPQKSFARRRRAVGRAAQPRRAGADRALARPARDASEPRWIPAVPVAEHGAGELAQGPDLQHARRRDPVPARRPDPLDARRGGLDWCVARTPPPPSTSTAGRAHPLRDAVRGDPAKRSLVVGTIDFDDGSTPPRSPRRCARTGSSTPSPTASWGATSCGSGCSPRSSPADVQALTACIEWVVERMAMSAAWHGRDR